MKIPTSDIAFTPAVKAIQERLGSRKSYAGMETRGGWSDVVTEDLREFLSQQDTIFLGTATVDGRPYIQHRGGAKGFLKVLDERTLGFADFFGNKQYISIGNLSENPKAFIFMIDFAHRRRIKLWGRAEVKEGDPELLRRLTDPGYPGRVERAFVFHLEAWDVNCPQHIKPRFTEEEVGETIEGLRGRESIKVSPPRRHQVTKPHKVE